MLRVRKEEDEGEQPESSPFRPRKNSGLGEQWEEEDAYRPEELWKPRWKRAFEVEGVVRIRCAKGLWGFVWVCAGCCNQVPQNGCLKTTRSNWPEIKALGTAVLEALRENLPPTVSQLWGTVSNPWCSLACRHAPPVSAFFIAGYDLPVCKTGREYQFFLLMSLAVIGLGAILNQYDLILTASWRRSVLGVHWKDWCWSWNSSTLATWCQELTHWKRPWCWEGLGAGGEGDDRGWDGWMVSPTRWAWVWVNSRSWWWTGRPGVLWFMGFQRVGHDWAIELTDLC